MGSRRRSRRIPRQGSTGRVWRTSGVVTDQHRDRQRGEHLAGGQSGRAAPAAWCPDIDGENVTVAAAGKGRVMSQPWVLPARTLRKGDA